MRLLQRVKHKAARVGIPLLLGGLHIMEHFWSLPNTLVVIGVAYFAEAFFEALADEDQPNPILV